MRSVRLYKMPEKVSIKEIDGARNLSPGVYEFTDYSDAMLVVEVGGWWVANSLGYSPDLNCRVEVLGIWNGSHPMGMS
jgi:hypothetical protein